jgi:3-methyladenine DNA glycosylase AlkD
MDAYVDGIINLFVANADPVAAAPMKAYMRNQFEYLGIKTPQRRELLQQFYAEFGLPPLDHLAIILFELWDLPEREFQYAALGILGKFEKQLPDRFIDAIERLITMKSWWDTVDSLAAGTVGIHFKRYPQIRDVVLPRWRQADDFWLRRTCILFQLNYKENTDFSLLKDILRENLGSKEFFINKAIGWALRQYTRVDPDGVRNFVAKTPLAPLSAREALKWLNRQTEKC